MCNLNAKCHGSILTYVNLNHPLIEYSVGNGFSFGEAISLTTAEDNSYFLEVGIGTTSAFFAQSALGIGLHLQAKFSNFSGVS